MSVWDSITGQDGAVHLLTTDIAAQRVSHAYLLTGPAGPVVLQAAEAFAAAVQCTEAGCGTCEICRRVTARAHPDIELIEPAGTQLLVEQVRDAVRSAWRSPVAGKRRVIIVDEADRMNPNAQNAFLKALEEPPASTTIMLIAPSVEALLDTVRSRCREVVFRTPGEAEIVAVLTSKGADADKARFAARTGGTLRRAFDLMDDSPAAQRRKDVIDAALIAASDPGPALEAAEDLSSELKALRERIAADHKEALVEQQDWFKETKRSADDRLRREQRRSETDALEQIMDDVSSVLRDLLAIKADSKAPLINEDRRSDLVKRSERLGVHLEAGVLSAMSEVGVARRRLSSNANVLLLLEHVFLSLHKSISPAWSV